MVDAEMNEAQKYLDAMADMIGQSLDELEADMSTALTKLIEKWGPNFDFCPASLTQGDVAYKLTENARTATRVALGISELAQYGLGLRSDPIN